MEKFGSCADFDKEGAELDRIKSNPIEIEMTTEERAKFQKEMDEERRELYEFMDDFYR